jgi:alcohol dehydrogenase (cytochrome c)
MVWALALGGMQDVGQNGPESRGQSAHRQRLHVHERRLGHDLQDRRAQSRTGRVRLDRDSGVRTKATRRARAASRSGKTGRREPADGRVIAINRDNGEIVWDKRVATKNEFGGQERFYTAPLVAEGVVLVQNGAGDGGTRGWVAGLDAKTGDEKWRFYTVPKPGDPGSETWKDDHSAWKTGGGGIWQTGAYDPETHLYIVGTGNPYPIYDPQFRPGDNLYTNSAIALDVRTASSPGTSSTRRTTRGTSTRSASTCCTT